MTLTLIEEEVSTNLGWRMFFETSAQMGTG